MKIFGDRNASLFDPDVQRIHVLADYNSEVARGLVHTEEWRAKMAEEQRWYNEAHLAWARRGGYQ